MVRVPFLSTPNDNPPAHPSKAFVGAAAQIERPRSYIGIEADRVALTKSVPPEGVYFQDIQEGRLYQWVGTHWETIGDTFLGETAISDNMPIAPRQSPRPFSTGGSAVAVGGPLGSGNPINDAVAGDPGYFTAAITETSGDGSYNLVDGNPSTLIMTFTALPALAASFLQTLILNVIAHATLTGVETITFSVLSDGVSIGTASIGPNAGIWNLPSIQFDAPATIPLFTGGEVITIKAATVGGNVTLVVGSTGSPNASSGILIATQVPV